MAFTFKFAPRVARLRLMGSATLAISAACSQGGELKEGFAPPLDTTVTRLVILPGTAQITMQDSQQFSLYGLNNSGDSLNANVDWEATGGTILPSGLFYASTEGTYRVTARGRGQGWGPGGRHRADTSVVVVSDTAQVPVLSAVILTPDAVTLSPGGTQQFSAAGRLTNGNATSVQVDYFVTGGSITGNGRYTAGATAGTFLVIATERGGSLADTSAVTISQSPPPPPTLTGVTLTPASVTLQAGATQQFTATGRWSDGSSSTVTVTFAATGGTITSLGVYTAGSTAGSFQVMATETSGLADTAQITVTATPPPPPTLQSVVLTPESVTLAAGATQQFSTSGLMSDGSTATVSVSYAATGGAINGAGWYTAGSSSGNFRVIATEPGGLADTSQITVTVPPPPTLTAVVLAPGSVTLQTGASQQFSASGQYSDGSSGSVTVSYSATGGTITGNGLYTAGTTAGTFRVIVTEPVGLADTAQINVTASPPPPPPPPPPSGTEIQRWDMDDWTITGPTGTTKWTNGSGNTPGWPHQLVGGVYRLDYPVTQYSSWLGWNFVGEVQFGSVTVDVDFRMNQPICTNTKGIRFDEGTKQWPGGHAWEGLYLNPTGGASCGFTVSFGGMSPYSHHTGAYFTSVGPTAGNGLVIVNNLSDGQWHHLKLTYDVGTAQKRMQLFVDGTLIAQPDGPSLQGSGFDGGCSGSVGPGAYWQNGWLVACNTRAESLIGSGRLLDINKGGQTAGTVLELDNWVWSN